MPSLWDNVKKSGQKTKIRGEMMLLEREANGRKKLFGIELYDLITNDKNKLLGVSAGTVFKGKIEQLKEPFERAKDDISAKQALIDPSYEMSQNDIKEEQNYPLPPKNYEKDCKMFQIYSNFNSN